MKTKIVPSTKENIGKAARLIRRGELVAFPTETVYGLGADALNEKAVAKIFKIKKRPKNNPLIVHLSKKEDLFKYGKDVPEIANKLIKHFWPGPLTLVVKKSDSIAKNVSAGLDTVAIRMPKNKTALLLIKTSKNPIAAPSANSFSKPSATKPNHILEDLNEKVSLILDGKASQIGIESTVLDLTSKIPTILRPGKITLSELKNFIKNIQLHPAIKDISKKISHPKTPGLKYRHYQPKAKVFLFKNKKELTKLLKRLNLKNKKFVVLGLTKEKKDFSKFDFISLGKDLNTFAKKLFDTFRNCDIEKIDFIFVKSFKRDGLGLAIMNRLEKASQN